MDTASRIPVAIEDEMKRSYLDYAMSVIIGRALPDIRDGLKPSHRRVLYGMRLMGLASNRAYRKSAKIVGEVMGNFHPHGDSAIYDTLVRMAQDFNMRYALVDGQGNFGSVDGDPPAAMRYTEARLKALAETLMVDLDKDTVDFVPNYDETTEEPTVLPTPFPNLLVNGSSGIAVGMATNIPPHNLGEVIDCVVWAIEHPEATADEKLSAMWRILPGPGLPDGRRDHRPGRDRAGVPDRPRRGGHPRADRDRDVEEGRPHVDRRLRDPVPGEQGAAHREDRRTGAREDDRGHLGPARRVGPRRHAHRDRPEARRGAGRRPEQPLQAHARCSRRSASSCWRLSAAGRASCRWSR